MKLKPLTRQQEKELLASLLISINSEFPNDGKSRVKHGVLFSVATVLLVAAWMPVLLQPTTLAVYFATAGTLAGAALMFLNWRLTGAMQWPALARCLDREKIEARLRELDA